MTRPMLAHRRERFRRLLLGRDARSFEWWGTVEMIVRRQR